jgi:putative flippase GtrA
MRIDATGEAARFGRFLVAGGIAAAANYGSRFLFSVWFPFPVAVALAFVVGLTTGFLLMRGYVFDARGGPPVLQAAWFTAINLVGLVLTMGISVGGAHLLTPYLGVTRAQAIAHAAGVAFPAVTSYVGHRLATFR